MKTLLAIIAIMSILLLSCGNMEQAIAERKAFEANLRAGNITTADLIKRSIGRRQSVAVMNVNGEQVTVSHWILRGYPRMGQDTYLIFAGEKLIERTVIKGRR